MTSRCFFANINTCELEINKAEIREASIHTRKRLLLHSTGASVVIRLFIVPLFISHVASILAPNNGD